MDDPAFPPLVHPRSVTWVRPEPHYQRLIRMCDEAQAKERAERLAKANTENGVITSSTPDQSVVKQEHYSPEDALALLKAGGPSDMTCEVQEEKKPRSPPFLSDASGNVPHEKDAQLLQVAPQPPPPPWDTVTSACSTQTSPPASESRTDLDSPEDSGKQAELPPATASDFDSSAASNALVAESVSTAVPAVPPTTASALSLVPEVAAAQASATEPLESPKSAAPNANAISPSETNTRSSRASPAFAGGHLQQPTPRKKVSLSAYSKHKREQQAQSTQSSVSVPPTSTNSHQTTSLSSLKQSSHTGMPTAQESNGHVNASSSDTTVDVSPTIQDVDMTDAPKEEDISVGTSTPSATASSTHFMT
jgi:hypothetical protein